MSHKSIAPGMDYHTYMSLQQTLHCGAMLKGSKAASIITIDLSEYKAVTNLLSSTRISHLLLKTRKNKAILYLYRKRALEEILRNNAVRDFLRDFGYNKEYSVERDLIRLSERVVLYGNGKADFPHEIGIFLDYPMEDVAAFIEKRGKDYLFSGYWKVYHNAGAARSKFEIYDVQRRSAVTELMQGKSISEIAV